MNKITKIIITALIFTIVSTLTVYLLLIVFNKLTISKDKDINVENKEIIKDTISSIKNAEIEQLKKEIENLKKGNKFENRKALNNEIIEYTTQVQFYILNNKEKSLKVLNSKLIKLKRYYAIKGLDYNTNRLLIISIKSIKNEIKSIKNKSKRHKKRSANNDEKLEINKKTSSDLNNNEKKENSVKKDTITMKNGKVNINKDTIN